MKDRRDAFPFAPLDIEDERRVVNLCGGDPTSLEGFRSFLAASGFEGMPLEWYRTYVSSLGADCLEALDITAPSAQKNLNRGVLLYAGIASEVAVHKPTSRYQMPEISPLPIHRNALRSVMGTDRTNLAIIALQQADDIPSFERLMKRFGDLFMVEDGRVGLRAARLGAGLIHYITLDSDYAIQTEEVESMTYADPSARLFGELEYDESLDRVKDLFDGAAWPDQS